MEVAGAPKPMPSIGWSASSSRNSGAREGRISLKSGRAARKRPRPWPIPGERNRRMNVNREALAWAAGFFDGEGSIYCSWVRGQSNENKHRRLFIGISQSGDPQTLHRFRDAVRVGTISGPYKHGRGGKDFWHLQIYRFEYVQACFAMLWPFLSEPKRAQIERNVKEYEATRTSEPAYNPDQGPDSYQSKKTHCPQGHPYDETNTYVWRGRRSCRTCNNAYTRRLKREGKRT